MCIAGSKISRSEILDSFRAKPGKKRSRPISRVLSWTVIPLGSASPQTSSSLPGPDAGHVMGSLFGLAPGGVCRAGPLPDSRCALTAPFHPCLILGTPKNARPSAVSFCCTFRRLAPPRRYLAPCPVEPGLSSAPLRVTRLPDRLRRAYSTASPSNTPKFAAQTSGPAQLLPIPAASRRPLTKGALHQTDGGGTQQACFSEMFNTWFS
jgi:hypothetical protein